MKKLIYSLLTLAAALSLASCQPDKLLGGKDAPADGTLVDATFSVSLGTATKAFADGTTVDQLYAGIYEIGANDAYTWAADNADSPIAISAGAATVTFNGKIALGKSYKVVFWAQKEGAPYAIDWAKSATTGPAVTATATGAANDETRDAFFGAYETGTVTGSIDLTGSPVTLKRPFAQVNVLVPIANFTDATASVTSSMTVAQAPTVLNLATKATSDPADWTFSTAPISEAAFGTYASTHKYVAMNYVLVDQTAADPRYDVTFSVTSGSKVAADKQVKNAPLKSNGRTNIVGNIFDTNFNITVPIVIGPTPGTDQVMTTVTVTVGQNPGNAVELTYNPTDPTTTSIEVVVNHPIAEDADKPTITVDPASVATAEWNLTTGKLDVTPLVENGAAVITLVFPSVTKTEYSSATVQVYVEVGDGKNKVATPTFSEAEGEIAANTPVVISTTTDGATIYFTVDGSDPTTSSQEYDSSSAGVVIPSALTLKAIAVKEGFSNSDIASATYTIAAPAQKTDQNLAFSAETDEATMGEDYTLLTLTGAQTAVTYTSSNTEVATIDGTTVTLVAAGETTITATAAEDETYNKGTASYTLTVNAAPVATSKTVTEIIALEDDAEFSAGESLVVAKYTRGVIVSDGTNAILVYNWENNASSTASLAIGDKITFDGTKASYNGVPQVNPVSNINVVSQNNPVTYPAASNITSTFDDYAGTKADYITFSGVLAVSGSYYNITVDGATTHQGSISYPLDASALVNGRSVTVTGYYNGLSSSKYVNIIVTNVEIAPYLNATPEAPTVNADVTSFTWNITSNTDWTITPGAGVTASKILGNGNAEVTLSFAANETNTAKTLTATASASGCEPVSITITQNGTGTVANPRYVKITSTSELTDGNYLIVYEDGSLAFNGGLTTLDAVSNTIAVTISEGEIAQSTEVNAAVFAISAIEGGYSIKAASGSYIGRTSSKNGMDTNTSAITNSISFESTGSATITSNNLKLRYNKTTGQTRFRYFTSDQEVIHLYKYTE